MTKGGVDYSDFQLLEAFDQMLMYVEAFRKAVMLL